LAEKIDMQKVPILGELEQAVLNFLWTQEDGTVKSVFAAIGVKRKISPNTIHTTLERLRKKGMLSREKVSHAYVYRTIIERSELLGKWLNEMINSYSAGSAEVMISAFADLSKTIDAKSLAKLEEMIKKTEE
jgi:predicted transcriptional regulator